MNCKEARDIIIMDVQHSELPKEIHAAIERHLTQCAGCRRYEESLSALMEPLRTSKIAEPPDGLWLAIKQEIEKSNEEKTNPFLIFKTVWQRRAFIFSLLLLMVFCGHYCASKIAQKESLSLPSSQSDFANHLTLNEFNDVPNEHLEKVYANIIGG